MFLSASMTEEARPTHSTDVTTFFLKSKKFCIHENIYCHEGLKVSCIKLIDDSRLESYGPTNLRNLVQGLDVTLSGDFQNGFVFDFML